jgi:hypothetical protein
MKKLFLLLAFLFAITTASFAGTAPAAVASQATKNIVMHVSSQQEADAAAAHFLAAKPAFPCALVLVFSDGSVLILFGDCEIVAE